MSSWGTPALILVFAAAGVATWIAGVFLSKATDVLDDRFNLGDAVGGMLLLGLAGSLPELAITTSAALSGHLSLAVGNLLGGIAMQTLVLVFLDARSGRKQPLTSLTADTSPLLESMLVIVLVTIALMGGFLPETTAVGPLSPASIAIVVFFLLGMLGLNRARQRRAWMIAGDAPLPAGEGGANRFKSSTTMIVLGLFGLASVVTLFAGVMLEQTGNQLADDFGMNGVVFGATILAAATALPEISSGIAAVRLGQVGLAMSDIYGGNAMQLTFFLLADLLAGSPVLSTASDQSLWLGATGGVVTAIFAYGLLVRNDKKVIGLGRDSLLVLATYIAAVLLLTAVPG
ncbi:MAG: sodium/hydrogen exchanger [Thermoleophilia bacterium]|nr:sodium/hydrogen exchanger [Thermoleophilia bacterium]